MCTSLQPHHHPSRRAGSRASAAGSSPATHQNFGPDVATSHQVGGIQLHLAGEHPLCIVDMQFVSLGPFSKLAVTVGKQGEHLMAHQLLA